MTSPERIADASDAEFDVATLVPDLGPLASDLAPEELRQELKRKVDALDYVIEELEAYAERTAEKAARTLRRAHSAGNRAAALRARVIEQMRAFGFERLPGHERYFERRRASQPALITTREPTGADAIDFEDLVEVVPVTYRWKNGPIKKALLAGELKVDWAAVKYSEYLHRDDQDRPNVCDRKKKRGRK